MTEKILDKIQEPGSNLLISAGRGFLFGHEVKEYVTRPKEEIPSKEEHVKLFLENRLKRSLDEDGIHVLNDVLAFVSPPKTLAECGTLARKHKLKSVVPVSTEGLVNVLLKSFEAVIFIGREESALHFLKGGTYQKLPIHFSESMLSSCLKKTLKEDFIVSSQKLAGNVEGAKRPTAGDEGCEVRAQNLAPLLHPEGGRVPPFIEKLDFIDLSTFLEQRTIFPGADDSTFSQENWTTFSKLQQDLVPPFSEARSRLSDSGKVVGLVGDLSGSKQFINFLRNILRVDLVPIGNLTTLVTRFGTELRFIPPAARFDPPKSAWIFMIIFLTLNLFIHQQFLESDVRLLKGINSVDRAIQDFWNMDGKLSVSPGDIEWVRQRLQEWRISWTELFGALEVAKPAQVMVEGVRMIPKETLRIEIQGLAKGINEIKQFLQNLQKTHGLGNVFLKAYGMKGNYFRFTLSLAFGVTPKQGKQ